jgi:hypothetical protein
MYTIQLNTLSTGLQKQTKKAEKKKAKLNSAQEENAKLKKKLKEYANNS